MDRAHQIDPHADYPVVERRNKMALHVPPREPIQTTGGRPDEVDPDATLWEKDPYAKTNFRRLIRRLLHSWSALGVTLVLIVGFVAAWRSRGPSHQGPIDVTYADIVRVTAYPVPNSSPPHVFARSPTAIPGAKPLEVLQSHIPSPFPGPD